MVEKIEPRSIDPKDQSRIRDLENSLKTAKDSEDAKRLAAALRRAEEDAERRSEKRIFGHMAVLDATSGRYDDKFPKPLFYLAGTVEPGPQHNTFIRGLTLGDFILVHDAICGEGPGRLSAFCIPRPDLNTRLRKINRPRWWITRDSRFLPPWEEGAKNPSSRDDLIHAELMPAVDPERTVTNSEGTFVERMVKLRNAGSRTVQVARVAVQVVDGDGHQIALIQRVSDSRNRRAEATRNQDYPQLAAQALSITSDFNALVVEDLASSESISVNVLVPAAVADPRAKAIATYYEF